MPDSATRATLLPNQNAMIRALGAATVNSFAFQSVAAATPRGSSTGPRNQAPSSTASATPCGFSQAGESTFGYRAWSAITTQTLRAASARLVQTVSHIPNRRPRRRPHAPTARRTSGTKSSSRGAIPRASRNARSWAQDRADSTAHAARTALLCGNGFPKIDRKRVRTPTPDGLRAATAGPNAVMKTIRLSRLRRSRNEAGTGDRAGGRKRRASTAPNARPTRAAINRYTSAESPL